MHVNLFFFPLQLLRITRKINSLFDILLFLFGFLQSCWIFSGCFDGRWTRTRCWISNYWFLFLFCWEWLDGTKSCSLLDWMIREFVKFWRKFWQENWTNFDWNFGGKIVKILTGILAGKSTKYWLKFWRENCHWSHYSLQKTNQKIPRKKNPSKRKGKKCENICFNTNEQFRLINY